MSEKIRVDVCRRRRRTNSIANGFDLDERVVFANECATPRAHDFYVGLDTSKKETTKTQPLIAAVCFGKLSSSQHNSLYACTQTHPTKWKQFCAAHKKTCRNLNENRYKCVIILAHCGLPSFSDNSTVLFVNMIELLQLSSEIWVSTHVPLIAAYA